MTHRFLPKSCDQCRAESPHPQHPMWPLSVARSNPSPITLRTCTRLSKQWRRTHGSFKVQITHSTIPLSRGQCLVDELMPQAIPAHQSDAIAPGKHAAVVRTELAALVARCRDNVASPYLVHRLPQKARPSHMRADERQHHTQLSPVQISHLFAKARESAGIDGKNPPTFHEIRSLGGAMLHKVGWTVEQLQALMGHCATAMTEHYLCRS